MTAKISAMTAASAAAGANELEINEAGTTKKVTLTQVGTLMQTLLNATFAAIGTTISAAGLATGGGSLASNRTITVTAANTAQTQAQSSSSVALTPSNLADFAAIALHPGYVSGRWYLAIGHGFTPSAGTAVVGGSIRMAPFFIFKAVTISTLGARITTAAASGNIQLGIYASSLITGLPTTLVANTGSISTTSTGVVSAPVVQNSGSVALAPGMYYMGVNADGTAAATAILQSMTSLPGCSTLIGSTTQSNISSSSGSVALEQAATATYNTWTADVTGTTAEAAANHYPWLQLKVA